MAYPNLHATIPATPQRPLPGAFLQTPAARAPAQQPAAQTAPSAAPQPSLPNLPPSATTQKPALTTEERGAQTIRNTLLQESRYPDLDSLLLQGTSSDYDLPPDGATAWMPFQEGKKYSIPDQIFDQYDHAQVQTSMGLFAELNHAWVSIDNALYLWDFTHPNPQLVGFEEQPNSINTVKLMKPRPGVFLPAITHLLVVATTAEVILLGMGVETTPTGARQVTLYQTGMAVPVKGLDVQVLASSDSTGRIFFGGYYDNDVHELTYQTEERWFQGRCSKINHTSSRFSVFAPSLSFTNLTQAATEHVNQMVVDDSRKLLYTLSSLSTIRVFHMKPDGSLSLAITKHAVDIYSNIGHIIASNETLNHRVKIISISPVPAAEASRYHLVATTATGYRIYLSATGSYSWSPAPIGTNAPTSMQAQHVKTPPLLNPPEVGSTALAPTDRSPLYYLNPTHMATRFPPGYFFCFYCQDKGQKFDKVFLSAPDPGRIVKSQENVISNRTAETGMTVDLRSRVQDFGLCSGPVPDSPGFGNELAIQFDQPAAEIAILTNTGIQMIRRRRLVDIFAELVRGGSAGEEGLDAEVKNLIRTYGRPETLSTALTIACGQGVEVASDHRLTPINDPDILEFARKVFTRYGGKPKTGDDIVTENLNAIDAVDPSPRHGSIALYISRQLRSIWDKQIVKVGTAPTGPTASVSVPAAKLHSIQHALSSLKEFFKANKSFINGLSGPEALARVSTKSEEIALQAEHRALHSLVELVSHTIEGISFVLVLAEERLDEIVATLPAESKQKFLGLTFAELFSTGNGHDIAKELVKGVVSCNIARGSNVETVAQALRRRCGSFCSPEDVVIFRAQEQLKRATEAGSNTELGRNLLNESLALFMEVADSLPMDYLVAAVDSYIANQFFAGAIQLALNVAGHSDKANLALSWIVDGRPEQDPRKAHFDFRKSCYDLVSKVMVAVDALAGPDPGMIDGQPTVIAKRQLEAYNVISQSADEVFLTSLYDWYLEQGWSERLLQTQSPFVITYLERKSNDNIAHADLLWRFFAQSERYFDAAKVQYQLAQSAFNLKLTPRIEYLGRARANASISSFDVGRQARQRLLQEIGALIDVANIQDDIYHKIKDDDRINAARKVEVLQDLDGPILDISTLFNQYADSASYYDICLQIFFLADHRNAADIKSTWHNLIEDLHEATVARGSPEPYEAVIEKVRSLGSRLRMSETVVPVRELVPMLERYSLEHQRAVVPPHWVVDLFLELGVAHESLYAVLEAMFYTDEAPFHGSNRRFIAVDLIYLLNIWFYESMRMGGMVFGSEVVAERVLETLGLVQTGQGSPTEVLEACGDLRRRIEELLR